MDSKGFRIRGEPDLVHQPGQTIVNQEVWREVDATKTVPAPDSRFRGYAAPLSDGRLVTDYRDKCVTRAPPGTQFAVKQWTVKNTDDIIRISRDRQVQNTGQALGTAQTELPAALYQHCTPTGCVFTRSGYSDGIGLERIDKAPELFGTFDFPPTPATEAKNKNYTALNTKVEYGRNTWNRWSNLYQ
jgi:hypothetical protein